MKKVFKRFVSIICTAVLLAVPTITASAASTTNVQAKEVSVQATSSWQCIADYSSGTMTYKEFAYTPAHIINYGGKDGLPNNAGQGGFLVLAGQKIVVSVLFNDIVECNALLFSQTAGRFVYSEYFYYGNSAQIVMVASQSGLYVPVIESLSSPIGVESYIVYVE